MKTKENKFNFKTKFLFILVIIFLIPLIVFNANIFNLKSIKKSEKKELKHTYITKFHNYLLANQDNFKLLSDLDFITDNNWSYNGWENHEIQKDKNQEGQTLSLMINGERRYFSRGVSIHGKGQATYDISSFSSEFPHFIAKIGVDAGRGNNGNLWIQISASKDGNNFISLLKTENINGNSEATELDVDIYGYKYLRIYVDPAGPNTSDHATIANAKFVTTSFNSTSYNKLKTVEYYDDILKNHNVSYNYENNYRQVLEREFVRKIGYFNIQDLFENKKGIKDTLDWILSDNKVLEQIIEVGEISNPITFMNVLTDLYMKNKKYLSTTDGYVYQKMMIALAAAYSTDKIISPLSFSFQNPSYDYIKRFEIMKEYYDNNKFKRVKTNALQGEFINNDWFKDYHVELMRMVMQDGTSNEDLVWLNGFTNEKQSISFYMIDYVSPVYTQDKFYDEKNKEMYDKKFYLSKYNIPYGLTNGVKVPRYWMVFANGGICWNASRVGQSMYRVNGIPSTGAYQVGHELYIQYYEDENGNGYWTPRYGNWSGAGSTWGGGNPYRYIFNWNNKSFADKHISGSKVASSTGYLYLGQANLNNYEKYKKSLYYNLIANSYKENNKKLEVYFKSLKVNDINLDSYDYIINIYKEMSENDLVTSHDWYELANKVIESYNYHPVAMFDLLKVIRPYLEGAEKLDIDRLEKEALISATNASSKETIQVDGVKTHARQLLGKAQPDPMTFSFDGENAGKIVKNPIYSLAWGYSLDGGKTFSKQVLDDSLTLTPEELKSITAENDIIINFMGLNYTFKIDITKGNIGDNLFANDLENKVVGVSLEHEWKYNQTDNWISYKESTPDLRGNKQIYIRKGACKTELPSEVSVYNFTENKEPDTRKYVTVDHLSIHEVSTEATSHQGAASMAIDGNYNTRWHSAWDGTDTQRFITIKIDKPIYVSAVEFVPAAGGNGKIIDGTVWGSYDGEKWEKLSEKKNITYKGQANTLSEATVQTQNFEILEPKEVQYIKIVADKTNGNWFTARNFNIFQDITKQTRPTATIEYSETNLTKENVIVKLLNPSTNITITNNNGSDTYTFLNNGKFTFEFIDQNGTKGTSTAKVDWIDKKSPAASLKYKNSKNKVIVQVINPSEEISYKTGNGTYEFNKNGSYDIYFYDKAGNIGKVTATIKNLNDNNQTKKEQIKKENKNIENNISNETKNTNKAILSKSKTIKKENKITNTNKNNIKLINKNKSKKETAIEAYIAIVIITILIIINSGIHLYKRVKLNN